MKFIPCLLLIIIGLNIDLGEASLRFRRQDQGASGVDGPKGKSDDKPASLPTLSEDHGPDFKKGHDMDGRINFMWHHHRKLINKIVKQIKADGKKILDEVARVESCLGEEETVPEAEESARKKREDAEVEPTAGAASTTGAAPTDAAGSGDPKDDDDDLPQLSEDHGPDFHPKHGPAEKVDHMWHHHRKLIKKVQRKMEKMNENIFKRLSDIKCSKKGQNKAT